MAQAQQLGHFWAQGLPLDGDDRLIARLRQVSAAQVQAVAQKYFDDDQLTVATLIPQPRDPNAKPRAPMADGMLR
jgi:zinc protease